MKDNKDIFERIKIKLNIFIYNYEYQILILSSIFSGLLILYITNKYFINTRLYYFLIIFGIVISLLGFLLEYSIKYFKRKSFDSSFIYFLQDLSREYKAKNSISLALVSISNSNVYGSIDSDIKRLANRVSWGDDFENALYNMNKDINSSVVSHTLVLLKTFKDSSIPFERVLFNISKDLSVFKEESQKKKYFSNIYNLSIFMYFIYIVIILFINIIFGSKFLWYGSDQLITRLFFDNFLLFISILFAIFTSFIMFSIKGKSDISFIKYLSVFFVITIILFQVFIPKPDAEQVLIESINHMNSNDLENFKINDIVALKSLNANYLLDRTYSFEIYFLNFENRYCGVDCAESTIFIPDAVFLNFEILKEEYNFVILYEILD